MDWRTLNHVRSDNEQRSQGSGSSGSGATGSTGSLIRAVALYTLARLALVAVFTLLILFVPRLFDVTVPFLAALAFGVLIALPLGMFLFRSLRIDVNDNIAAVDAERRRKHDDLQARLRGK
ncbi:DUF4229 domain-containing protein [Gordonia pseudamarae]|jgi:MFS superfamily sulfate permease-like transporter|uniref:DUF4229 domain-containing protein n=1 Tax=Gordonia pseudamarae TaxID=2831662 RepID=A0ABX6IMQ1_9ACTN|nr:MULTISPECIES: DUF4229 domain-containing protein [Gordonia]MBD0020649.1 DUF4229 domain-containing protein [Gordonia sp. (in: high G+C Gram-positive bacteria)]QHN27693.1 DUF4229 domain-containing protein [Gordonia pseudamarae]QHN36575.1 DUF4229 domain-containing protein [Gordonia pseudamarae]